jgi:hypothetical protein
MKTNNNLNKSLVPLALTLMVALITMTLCLISSAGTPQPSLLKTNTNTQLPTIPEHKAPMDDRGITWELQMNFSETGGKTDYAKFGEAPDARDGPPADTYDTVKPPAPMAPYIRAFFNDNLPTPYNYLWMDCRQYPDTSKVWNLSVKWEPEDGESPTTLTISWSKSKINASEYDKVNLTDNNNVVLVNMRTTSSYTYTAPASTLKKFKINCTIDAKTPQIINRSPGTGETGDSFTFNASVFDDMTPTSSLIVRVNWAHGSLSGNDTMINAGGNFFVKTITLSNNSTSALTYHFYAKDNAKVPNINYTTQYSATVSDDESPVITGNSGSMIVGTGDKITLWVTVTDNVAVISAKITIDVTEFSMAWNGTVSRWEYVYTAPGGSTTSYTYFVKVSDAAANSQTSTTYGVTVFDNDAPIITGNSGVVSVGTGDKITLWVTATDNVAVISAKITIDVTEFSMAWNGTVSRWEYVYTAPGGSTTSHTYFVKVSDVAVNTQTSTTYGVTVFDNDAPIITGVTATPTLQIVNGHVNITATITDNINLLEKKLRTTGPAGYTPVNITMTHTGGNTYYYNSTYTIAGVYNYSLWVKDTSNNGATSTIHQFNIFAELQITTLKTGWNFVSLPFNLTITKTNLFVISGVTRYTWGQAVANSIIIDAVYNWTESQQMYNTPNSLKPGKGYWLYAYSECQLWATNLTPITSTSYITPLISLWNVIGVPIGSSVSKTNLIVHYMGVDYNWTNAVANGYVVKDIFGWSRTAPQGYFMADVIDPGYCYWIYAYVDCTLKRT